MDTLPPGVQRKPALPEGFPARRSVPSPSKIPTHPGDFLPKRRAWYARWRQRTSRREEGHRSRVHALYGRRLRRASCQIAQLQQAYRDGSEQSQPAGQPLGRVAVTLRDAPAGFAALVIVSPPAPALPLPPQPGVRPCGRFQGSQQDPFKRFLPGGRRACPHPHHPDRQRDFASTRVSPGRQQRHGPEAERERRLPGLSPLSAWHVKGLLVLARPGSSWLVLARPGSSWLGQARPGSARLVLARPGAPPLQKQPDGLLLSLNAAALGGADDKVGLGRAAAAPKGQHVSPAIPHMHPQPSASQRP
jgi:hypothetical protein